MYFSFYYLCCQNPTIPFKIPIKVFLDFINMVLVSSIFLCHFLLFLPIHQKITKNHIKAKKKCCIRLGYFCKPLGFWIFHIFSKIVGFWLSTFYFQPAIQLCWALTNQSHHKKSVMILNTFVNAVIKMLETIKKRVESKQAKLLSS